MSELSEYVCYMYFVSCQNCYNKFSILPEDSAFYAKISVPPPTFCPRCRFQRRLLFCNERRLFKRKDSFTGKEIVSLYPQNVLFPVYEQSIWFSDKWEAMDYGRPYDFSRPFFEQFRDLLNAVPRYALTILNSPGCSYCPKIINSKNCYLTVGYGAEDCLYGNYNTRATKDCADYFFMVGSESCYETIYCTDCRNVFFSQYAVGCRDSSFLYDCVNCSDCFGCVGLRNKQYHVFNKPYAREEYERIMGQYDRGSFAALQEAKKEFERLKLAIPRRFAMIMNSVNTVGNDVAGANNCYACFDADAEGGTIENCKYLQCASQIKDTYDAMETGEGGELCYEVCLSWGYRILFSNNIPGDSHDVQYSDTCFSSNNLFGCVGLRKKQYCILNVQYTKTEYEALVPNIIEHMNLLPYRDANARIYGYGEFFPAEISPFAYNETLAKEYFPLGKEEVDRQGYQWRDSIDQLHTITCQASGLADHIDEIDDGILRNVIGCLHGAECADQCTKAFKLIPQELKFYQSHNLPLPRLCPNCRHYERVRLRNPIALWNGTCQCQGTQSKNGAYQNKAIHTHGKNPCGNEFETTYEQARKEIIYCQACYQTEII